MNSNTTRRSCCGGHVDQRPRGANLEPSHHREPQRILVRGFSAETVMTSTNAEGLPKRTQTYVFQKGSWVATTQCIVHWGVHHSPATSLQPMYHPPSTHNPSTEPIKDTPSPPPDQMSSSSSIWRLKPWTYRYPWRTSHSVNGIAPNRFKTIFLADYTTISFVLDSLSHRQKGGSIRG
jgi:hypothetical protein